MKRTSFLSFAAYFKSFRHNWHFHIFFLVCMCTIFVLLALLASLLSFSLDIAPLSTILQQLMLLLLAISLLAKVQLRLSEYFSVKA